MPLKLEEVVEACEWLERDYDSGGLRDEIDAYETIYQLNHVPKLGDEISRGRTVVYPVPRLSEFIGDVIAQVISYATFPVVTSLGGLSDSEADRIEAALGVSLAEINEGQALTKDAYRTFLKDPYCVYQLVPGKITDPWPFRVDLPDLRTCFFERQKPGRPPTLARSYDMLVGAAEGKYTNLRGEHEGAGKKAVWNNKTYRFDWTALSAEFEHDNQDGTARNSQFGELVHIQEFYDAEYCYHVVNGRGRLRTGQPQEVFRSPTPAEGPPFVIVPSALQGARLWREDWRPLAWSMYTRILQIERIESIRATRSEHIQDHIIARMPPDQAEAVSKLRAGGYSPVLHGGVNFIPMAAEEIQFWSQVPDADLAQRSQELKAELERAIAAWLYPATEQTVSQANVGTAQISMQVVHQHESALLSNHSMGMAQMAEMMLCALSGEYAQDREVYARSEVTYGEQGAKKVSKGSTVKLSAETLKKLVVYGPEANIRVEVITRSETESELEQREAGVWNNVQRGSQTMDEYIAVRNPDVTGQHEKLAADGVRRMLAAQYDMAIPIIAAKRVLERWGVDINRLLQPQQPQPSPPQLAAGPGVAPGAGAGGGGGTVVTQAAPMTGGADIGSSGAMPAGSAMAA